MDGTWRTRSIPALIHLLFLRPVLKLLLGVHVEGREHLAGLDRFILVANHNSHLDVLLLCQVLPTGHLRRTHPVAAWEYFSRSRLVRWLAEFLLQPVWIVRGGGEGDPLAAMGERLARGCNLIVFPEGTRGRAGELEPFKGGVGRLAAEFPEVPVVPVFLTGPERALPKTRSLLVPVWHHVTVGAPRFFHGTPGEFTAELERAFRGFAAEDGRRRHRRQKRTRRPPVLAVLGIDGSGKSTLSRALSRSLSTEARACLVSDDVEIFERGARVEAPRLLAEKLRESVGRRSKEAASLKSYKIPKLVELLLRDHVVEELRRWYAPDVVVTDGSPLLNIAAWTGLYRVEPMGEEACLSVLCILSGQDRTVPANDPVYRAFPELESLKRVRLAHLSMPDAVLFLDVDPMVSMERIRSRGERQQVHETEEKLARLQSGYRTVCRVLERDLGIPARALAGEGAARDVLESALAELRRMERPALSHLPALKQEEVGDG